MTKEEELLKKRFTELADRSYSESRYTFTNFLNLNEQSLFYLTVKENKGIKYTISGGISDAERVMVRFGDEAELGYDQQFPIAILSVSPLAVKYSEDLSHRDYLGALMNLGIEREMLGDIIIGKNEAYIVCHETMAEFISDNLTRVRNTSVKCGKVSGIPDEEKPSMAETLVQIPSNRVDAVIARVFNLSRSEAASGFKSGKVFINGRLCENTSHELNEGDRVTLRGHGRFIFKEITGTSKKGKLNIKVLK